MIKNTFLNIGSVIKTSFGNDYDVWVGGHDDARKRTLFDTPYMSLIPGRSAFEKQGLSPLLSGYTEIIIKIGTPLPALETVVFACFELCSALNALDEYSLLSFKTNPMTLNPAWKTYEVECVAAFAAACN